MHDYLHLKFSPKEFVDLVFKIFTKLGYFFVCDYAT